MTGRRTQLGLFSMVSVSQRNPRLQRHLIRVHPPFSTSSTTNTYILPIFVLRKEKREVRRRQTGKSGRDFDRHFEVAKRNGKRRTQRDYLLVKQGFLFPVREIFERIP